MGKARGFLKNFLIEPFVPHSQVCVRWLQAGSSPSWSLEFVDPEMMKGEIKLLEKSQRNQSLGSCTEGLRGLRSRESRDEGTGLVCSQEESGLVTASAEMRKT